jgi:hypothetical protein
MSHFQHPGTQDEPHPNAAVLIGMADIRSDLEAVMHLGPKVHGAREHQTGKSDEVQPC